MVSPMPKRLVWHTNKASISLSCWYTNMVTLKSYARAPLNECYSRIGCLAHSPGVAPWVKGVCAIPRSAVVTTNYPLVLAGKKLVLHFRKRPCVNLRFFG